jgi:uncharacterized cupredoxin-like copper-binding protein
MKRITRLPLLVVATMMLSACASPTPTIEPTVEPQPTVEQLVPAATEPAPSPEDPTQAPLPAERPTQIEITLADNTISSPVNAFQAGVPYTFVIGNNGRREHNFNITAPVALAGGYREALAQALLAVDETQIPPGSSMTVEFTFPESAVGAVLEFSCLIRKHYEDGMLMDITVTN